MKLSPDRLTADIAVNATLTASDMERLILDLADLRATMDPAVPMERPTPGANTTAVQVASQEDASLMAALRRDGSVRLWIRSAGLGWLAFGLSQRNTITLRDYLNGKVQDAPGASQLIGNQGTKDDDTKH